jgi:hypothetical protein
MRSGDDSSSNGYYLHKNLTDLEDVRVLYHTVGPSQY